MSTLKLSKARLLTTFAAMILAAGGLATTLCSAEPDSSAASPTNSAAPNVSPTNTVKVAVKYQLTGAELYSMHCNRCHPERYPTERTAAQWKTIMLHMQVRANIPKKQANLILQYLQDNSGR
jgi:cytochrome c5